VSRTVLFAGGGTAGHVFPAIATAQRLTELAPDVEPVFVGVNDRLEARLVPEAGFPLHLVTATAVPRRPSPALLRLPGTLRAGVRTCTALARETGALAAATFGGYVSFPLDRAAGKLGLPLVIHEQNSVPGITNRLAARWADRIAITFPGSAHHFRYAERCVVTGDPVRQDVLKIDRSGQRAAARVRLGLEPDRPTLLAFGGSQGARSINRAVVAAYHRWSGHDLQILHAAGANDYAEAARRWEQARAAGPGPAIKLVDFIEGMSDAYAAADVVVCRAGATSIAELTALGIPAVLVPYPHATADHQTANAAALERAGGAVVVADEALDGTSLVAAAEPLLRDADRHSAVARASRAFGRPDAGDNVARLILELLDARSTP
jgi:UDP-N-acetylglucosamine--N-acetylmuramyl-(pentapeptide) pyrophosphoryl-undecaprenol N-acetylglucosamine transferase